MPSRSARGFFPQWLYAWYTCIPWTCSIHPNLCKVIIKLLSSMTICLVHPHSMDLFNSPKFVQGYYQTSFLNDYMPGTPAFHGLVQFTQICARLLSNFFPQWLYAWYTGIRWTCSIHPNFCKVIINQSNNGLGVLFWTIKQMFLGLLSLSFDCLQAFRWQDNEMKRACPEPELSGFTRSMSNAW